MSNTPTHGRDRHPTFTASSVVDSGYLSGVTIGAGGSESTLTLVSGGLLVNSTVTSGGELIVSSGAEGDVLSISGGGLVEVDSGGLLRSPFLFSGTIDVDQGGHMRFGYLLGGDVVIAGGETVSSWLEAGQMTITHGGLVKDLSMYTETSGRTPPTLLIDHGIDKDAQVHDGTVIVGSHGTDSGSYFETWSTPAQEIVTSGGQSIGDSFANGASLSVQSGGIADGATIGAGAVQTVYAGGYASGGLVNSGGTDIIAAGATVTGLTIANGAQIDFSSLSFVASGSVSFNVATDLLTVTEGSNQVTLQLAGTYASGTSFTLANDGHGGTLLQAVVPDAADFAPAHTTDLTHAAALVSGHASGMGLLPSHDPQAILGHALYVPMR